MKLELTMPFIKRLRIDQKPAGFDERGELVFEPNPEAKEYIVYDASQEAPPGFGVKVSKKKTFVIRRKINGKSIMPTVGNVADFMVEGGKSPLSIARSKAAAMALKMVDSGQNPNAEARKASAAELTLGRAFEAYREHLRSRTARPAGVETLRVVDRVNRRFEKIGWLGRKVRDIEPDEVREMFKEGGAAHPVANEQAFRLAATAVAWHIGTEALSAAMSNRVPMLRANPFSVLVLDGMYRTRQQKEALYEERNIRSPLSPKKTLGSFLEVAWSKSLTNDNATGVHYLIFMLLWGCRRSEHARCQWGSLVAEGARKATSHVSLEMEHDYGPHVFFHKTKGGKNHRLPIGPMALNLLKMREAAAAKEVATRGFGAKSRAFVFPARNKFSKTGHYSNADELRSAIIAEAGIARLTNHDLRRSFGTLMTSINAPEAVKSALLNHAKAHVTEIYTPAEWSMLREWMEKIEQAIFVTAPNVYNALKPVDWPMLPAPEPHVCKPAAPRTGRPRKKTTVVSKIHLNGLE